MIPLALITRFQFHNPIFLQAKSCPSIQYAGFASSISFMFVDEKGWFSYGGWKPIQINYLIIAKSILRLNGCRSIDWKQFILANVYSQNIYSFNITLQAFVEPYQKQKIISEFLLAQSYINALLTTCKAIQNLLLRCCTLEVMIEQGKYSKNKSIKMMKYKTKESSFVSIELLVIQSWILLLINNMEKNTPKVYTAILFIPALGFFLPNQAVNQKAYFLVVLALIAVAYFSYWLHFKNNVLNLMRKYVGCFCTGTLILILSAQVSDILINVYKVDFAEDISFAIKMIFMLSNMQGNLQLCVQKRSHQKVVSSQNSPLEHAI